MALDGSIIIDTQIDTSGLKDYATELKRLTKEAEKTDSAIEKMRQKMGRHLELGGSTDDKTYMRMQYDLAQLEIKQADYADTIKETETAYRTATQVSVEGAGQQAEANNIAKEAVKEAGKETQKMGEESEKAFKKAGNSSGLSLRKIIAYSLGIRSLYSIFGKLRSACKEAFGEIAKQSPEFNQAITSVKNSLADLRYNVGAMVAPLVEALAPVIVYLSDLFSELAFRIQQMFGALTGKGVIAKAKNTASAISKVGSASEKALASYDKLDVINGGGSGGGGSGGSGSGGSGESGGALFNFAGADNPVKEALDALEDRVINEPFKNLNLYEKAVKVAMLGIENTVDTLKKGYEITKETVHTMGEEVKEFNSLETGAEKVDFVLETISGTAEEVDNILEGLGKKLQKKGIVGKGFGNIMLEKLWKKQKTCIL